MPNVTRVNGSPFDRFEATGRTLYQYKIASATLGAAPYAVNSNYAKILTAMQQWGTIEILGRVGFNGNGGADANTAIVFMSGNEDTVHPVDADLTTAKTGAADNVTLTKLGEYTVQGLQT